jgi:hypothetical protein
MAIGSIAIRLIGAAAIFATTSAKADDYEMIYSRGNLRPSFEKCLGETFKQRSIAKRAGETVSYFTKIYNMTYGTHAFSHMSAFRHIEISDENRSPLIVTIAVLRQARGLPMDDRGHQLASIVPLQAVSYVDGHEVYHGQVESRQLDDKDRANFKVIVGCAGKS